MTRVLVTDARRGSALAFIRSLGRRGDHVVAADATTPSAGLRSRWAAGRVAYPSPADDPGGTGDALVEAAHRHRIELIIPITDEVILALRDRVADLPPDCRVAMPDARTSSLAADKRATMDLAVSLGVPIPTTIAADTPEAVREAAGRLGYPVVLKPVTSRIRPPDGGVRRYTVTYARDPDELERAIAGLGEVGLLVQSYWAGEGQGVELLLDRGRVLAAFQHRRLREVPVTGGASSLRESTALDPVLLGHAARLLEAMAFHGLAMVEFRVGPGGPVLMEVNGRVWGSLPLAVAAGMDFPTRLVDLYVRERPTTVPPSPSPGYKVGIRARNLELDLVWAGSVLRGRRGPTIGAFPPRHAALRVMLDLLDPRIRDDILSLRDPLPGAAELLRIGGVLASKLGRGADAG